MFSRILSAVINGVEGLPVFVEADVSEGLQGFSMVGDLAVKVREAQDRVTTAFRNSGIRLQPRRVTINLSPGDVHKDGTGFDLPIALAVLSAYGMIQSGRADGVMAVGELSLNGAVRGVRGVLPIVLAAKRAGCRACLLPAENLAEAEIVSGIRMFGAASLKEAIQALESQNFSQTEKRVPLYIEETDIPDFCSLRGQGVLRRAAEVAVAGRHNFLMIGSPGTGKSLLAKCVPGILPPLSEEEMLEVSSIYSVAGMLTEERPIVINRPFRAPHHTISPQALAGGGRIPRPGEISLAHKGVLFLDELPEFRRETLEVLRQPMEDRKVHVARVYGNCTFPADTMVIGAMNPCKCGYYPDMSRCTCTEQEVRRYQKHISTPLLDRMDIGVEVARTTYEELCGDRTEENSAQIGERVERARRIQRKRYEGSCFGYNGDLAGESIRKYVVLDGRAESVLREAYKRLELSGRACHRILKVARTIADLAQKEFVQEEHICEAVSYRIFEKR